MAYPVDHKNDTLKAIGDSATKENAEILQQLVHITVDGQTTAKGNAECKIFLQKLDKAGIVTVNELCGRFIKEGVDKAAIDKYNGDIEQFLVDWLLPPHGPKHQLYTHKGWDYDYSLEDDKDYWGALEIKQSWEVKKYLFVKTFEKTFSVCESSAIALAVLFYNIHRFRDIQYNSYDETTAGSKKYLFNACYEMEKYVLPLIGDKDLNNQVQGLVDDIKKVEARLSGPIDDDFWESLNGPIDKLLGSIDNAESGLASKAVSALLG